MNIADILAEHARSRPDHPAIEDGDRVVTYGDLAGRVADAAANLQAAGIRAGDRIGIMLDDSAEHLITLYALLKAGAVMVSIGLDLPQEEKDRTVSGLGVKAVITAAGAAPVAGLPLLSVGEICRQRTDGAAAFAAPDLDDDHPAMIIQSSGTTGTPKSFLRSHANMKVSIRRFAQYEGWTADDRYVAIMHMSFLVGRNTCLGMLYLGATAVVHRAPSVEALVMDMRDKRITVAVLTPAHLQPLLDYAEGKPLLFPGLRVMAVGTAPTTQEQRRRARERLTPNVLEWFGINEAGLLAIAHPADQDAYPESVGRLADDIEAQVLDGDGTPLPPGEVGPIRFRGPGFSSSYLGDPDASARAFRDGWFYPGDLAELNAERYLFFKGRADDIINNEGAKFYPIEVENVLRLHPTVTDAAVFAWPHARHGQVAVAYVVTTARVTPVELGRFCRQHIAPYKGPAWVEFVAEMPRNPMGKILKNTLKAMFSEKMAGQPLS